MIKPSVHSLKKDISELKTNLSASYRKFGHKLFNDAVYASITEKNVSEGAILEWQELLNSRQSAMETVTKIKSTADRIDEVKKFRKQLEKTIIEQQKKIKKIQEGFALGIYEKYSLKSLSDCGDVFETVTNLEQERDLVLIKLEEKKQEQKETNVFLQVLAKPHLLRYELKIKDINKKIKKTIEDEAQRIVSDPYVEELHEKGTLLDTALVAHTELSTAKNLLKEIINRQSLLGQESESLDSMLKENMQEPSVQKTIHGLTDKIKDINISLDNLLERYGREYANAFYNDEGISLENENSDTALNQEYRPFIEEIASIRVKITKTSYNIEYLEVEAKIKQEEKKIASFERNITDYKKGIEDYKRMIQSTENNLEIAHSEKDQLTEQSENLLQKF